jgi:hypothetical protein
MLPELTEFVPATRMGIVRIVLLGTGARCVRKKKKKKILYNTTRGELTCSHFFKSSC